MKIKFLTLEKNKGSNYITYFPKLYNYRVLSREDLLEVVNKLEEKHHFEWITDLVRNGGLDTIRYLTTRLPIEDCLDVPRDYGILMIPVSSLINKTDINADINTICDTFSHLCPKPDVFQKAAFTGLRERLCYTAKHLLPKFNQSLLLDILTDYLWFLPFKSIVLTDSPPSEDRSTSCTVLELNIFNKAESEYPEIVKLESNSITSHYCSYCTHDLLRHYSLEEYLATHLDKDTRMIYIVNNTLKLFQEALAVVSMDWVVWSKRAGKIPRLNCSIRHLLDTRKTKESITL
jgi:hypothetical protein